MCLPHIYLRETGKTDSRHAFRWIRFRRESFRLSQLLELIGIRIGIDDGAIQRNPRFLAEAEVAAKRVVVNRPRDLEHHHAAVFKPHPCRAEFLDIHHTAPPRVLLRNVIFGYSGDAHRLRIPHRIQRVVHVVNADVHRRARARCLLIDEGVSRIAAPPASRRFRIVDIAE